MSPQARIRRKDTRKAARGLPGGTGRRHGLSQYVVARRALQEDQ